MSISYGDLRAAVERRAVTEGVPVGTAAMRTMALAVMGMAADVPRALWPALVAGVARWLAPKDDRAPLEEYRVASWAFLERKNASSVVVNDAIDIAVRALIFILWDEAYEGPEVDDGLEFFAELVTRYGGLERAVTARCPS